MKQKDKLYTLIAFLISLLILFLFYHKSLININDYVFASGGDGIKNYYTYIYHAMYDTSFFEFSGMNYPFHENIVYTDAHPLLSYLVGKLGLANYGIGILNFLMLISYPISTIFIYKIFKHFNISVLWSILASVALTFMAPQVFRMTGHLSMSYVFAIPIIWYLLIQTSLYNHFKWNIITAIYLIIFFFTHPYLGLILTIFAFSYWVIVYIQNKKTKSNLIQFFINIGYQVVLPILFFKLLVFLNDPHIGRLNNPSGFYNNHASFSSFLIEHHGPLLSIKAFLGLNSGNWESWSYLGLATIINALVILGYLVKNFRTIDLKEQFKKPLFMFFTASFLVLLLSMCVPFKWEPFKWMVDVISPLKQFRVLGRFSWVFFYVFTIFIIILLYKIKEKLSNKTPISILFFLGIIMFYLESKDSHKYVSDLITQSKNPFKIENIEPELKEIIDYATNEKYDAIIFLPFTHMSSESVYILGAEQATFDALMLSYHTNTPLMNTISSRTSLQEAIYMINLFSPAFIDKGLSELIGNDKKILLVKNQDELDSNEQRMTEFSDQIYQNNTFTAYNFTFNKWNNDSEFKNIIHASKLAKTKLKNNWFSDTTTWFYYDSFDELEYTNSMSGKGAFVQKKIGWNKLIELDSNLLSDGNYILSFWYNISIGRPDLVAVVEKIENDTTIWVDQFKIRETNLIVDEWAYVELNFSFVASEKVNILLTGGAKDEWLVVDELLIRKVGDPKLFRYSKLNNAKDDYLIMNNYWIKKNSTF